MLRDAVRIIRKGDKNGNGMVIRLRLSSGLEILGLATHNSYGGDWDLGPTWNYLVLSESPFLVDTGRLGMGKTLLEMMGLAGVSGDDLDSVVVSHGHEDHDGALAEIATLTGAKVKAHYVYDRLIRFYPDSAPTNFRKNFPASCWRCFMPEAFSTKNCVGYHKARSRLTIEPLNNGRCHLGKDIYAYHLPGHSPDALAVLLGDEALIVGDTILPDITPWPSQEDFFHRVKDLLRPPYETAQEIYGLRAYVRSLKRLKTIAGKFPDLILLPAHRLFYGDRWNEVNTQERADELIRHHVERSGDILKILAAGPKTARQIAVEHFDEPLLKGFGILMAEHEVLSHCELLIAGGDAAATEAGRFQATGTANFEALINALDPR